MCVSLALLYDATLIYKCSPPNLKGGIHLTTAYQFFSHQQSSLLALKKFFFLLRFTYLLGKSERSRETPSSLDSQDGCNRQH